MFKETFYNALRNTLVCDDLDSAIRIGYGVFPRCRVVTLKGEIVEMSGMMRAGGRSRVGGMSSRFIEEFSEE